MKELMTLVVVSTLLSACVKITEQPVTIGFSAVVDSKAVACDTVYHIGKNATPVTLNDFRFYVNDVTLITASGKSLPLTLTQNDWQNGNVALLDFVNKASGCEGTAKPVYTTIKGMVQNQDEPITGVSFNVGVPEDRNHLLSSSQPSPLNISSLFWSWQSGYKHMRLDYKLAEAGKQAGGNMYTSWDVHLGSTRCTGKPQKGESVSCKDQNRPTIRLDGFDPQKNKIQLDFAAFTQGLNVAQDSGGASGCFSDARDPECQVVFSALGLKLADGPEPAKQTAFSVVQ